MTPPPTALSKTESSGLPNVWDILFLTALVCVIAFVSWVGTLNYRQGMKTEVTKDYGRAWLDWFTENGPKRGEEGFAVAACAGGLTPDDVEKGKKPEDIKTRWGECQAAVAKSVESLGGQKTRSPANRSSRSANAIRRTDRRQGPSSLKRSCRRSPVRRNRPLSATSHPTTRWRSRR